MDLILRRARLTSGTLVDIGVEDGVIVALEPELTERAKRELDAGGLLTLPAFVNGQLHACKAFWRRGLATLSPAEQALPRFEAAKRVKRLYTPEDVAGRVEEAVQLALQNGTCAIRLFADVDEESGLTALYGLLRVKARYAHLLSIQIAAFPQEGLRTPRSVALLRDALRQGADVVAGIPWTEPDPEARRAHSETCFDLAEETGKPLHFVCDDTLDPGSRTLEDIARIKLARNFSGRVAVTQCAALAFYPDDYAASVIDLVAQAGLTVFSNTHVSLVTSEAEQEPRPRGVTRISELLRAGVPVACAQDDIDNWYYPFGKNDMLEVAAFMAHTAPFAWGDDPDKVLPMVSHTPAAALGLTNYGLSVSCQANLVVLEAPCWREALQFQPPKRFVVLRGRLVAETVTRKALYLDA